MITREKEGVKDFLLLFCSERHHHRTTDKRFSSAENPFTILLLIFLLLFFSYSPSYLTLIRILSFPSKDSFFFLYFPKNHHFLFFFKIQCNEPKNVYWQNEWSESKYKMYLGVNPWKERKRISGWEKKEEEEMDIRKEMVVIYDLHMNRVESTRIPWRLFLSFYFLSLSPLKILKREHGMQS